MGRLLEALRAESGKCPPANPAKVANASDEIRRFARFAAPTFSQNERLLAAIRGEALPDSLLSAHDGTYDDLAALTDEHLSGYVAMLAESDLRERGDAPPDDTARALCRHCGPVWIHPDIARVAPVIDGWPRLIGCPWCHVRNRRELPRPLVVCGDCQNFIRDTVSSRDGMGSCGAGCNAERPWPRVQHACAAWRPKNGE